MTSKDGHMVIGYKWRCLWLRRHRATPTGGVCATNMQGSLLCLSLPSFPSSASSLAISLYESKCQLILSYCSLRLIYDLYLFDLIMHNNFLLQLCLEVYCSNYAALTRLRLFAIPWFLYTMLAGPVMRFGFFFVFLYNSRCLVMRVKKKNPIERSLWINSAYMFLLSIGTPVGSVFLCSSKAGVSSL